MRRFHHADFPDPAALARLKNGRRVAVCIPTLDEAGTIGPIVTTIRQTLADDAGLVDEVIVIDSDSADATVETARRAGARAFRSGDIAPGHGTFRGKGENLWKSQFATDCDILCFVDGDIANFHGGFVTGLVGPLLSDPELGYVKAFYERPLAGGDPSSPQGGGRVSEILIRPLISLFYPELTEVIQPLAGEYAARRDLLAQLPFPTGYGVEIAHLLDILHLGRIGELAQTDLVSRVHRNRSDGELGDMSFALLRVILRRLQRDAKLKDLVPLPELHRRWLFSGNLPQRIDSRIAEPERPPVAGTAAATGA